jgi:hypothetical protein
LSYISSTTTCPYFYVLYPTVLTLPTDEQEQFNIPEHTNYLNNVLGAYHDQFPENNLGVSLANGKSTYTPTNDNPTTFSWFSPYLGGGIVGNLTPALLPIQLTRGLGLGVWLAYTS